MVNKKKTKYTIGIDIGGTKMSAILFNGKKIVADYILSTPKDTLDHFFVMLKALIEPLEERARKDKVEISGIGVGIAGVLDSTRRRVLNSPNLQIINNIDIADRIEAMYKLPVEMDNDVNCFVYGEAKMGIGQKYNNFYGITIGTGIGGCWWLNGNIYRGAHGGGGEPGEMVIDFENKTVLEKAYHTLTQYNPAQMAEEAYRGDLLAEKVYAEVGEMLGVALANIVNLIDPEVIIIGGGVIESGDLFLSKTKKSMRDNIFSSEVKKKLKIIKSKQGKHAGAIGAALMGQGVDKS